MIRGESSLIAGDGSPISHIEVALELSLTPYQKSDVKSRFESWVKSRKDELALETNGEIDRSFLPSELLDLIVKARIVNDGNGTGCSCSSSFLPGSPFLVHTFELSREEISIEEIEPSGGGDEWTAGCDTLPLPHVSLDDLWENLFFDSNIKHKLLEYAHSAILFSDRKVSANIVRWNRILLLHGVPGTGKTSLCRALAHKLAIRLSDRFQSGTLIEIHSHSLFSKWFSTSGKLVSALFSMVRDMVEDDPHSLVCVLIDEVESLASSRNNSAAGDPSDAMRAVNSLLTSLDRLRSFPNVLVLATTNITGLIDAAFVDRVDLKLRIELPILQARYEILRTCVEELIRVGILTAPSTNAMGGMFADFSTLSEGEKIDFDPNDENLVLLNCARRAEGFSGRSLRRLPLQAHSQFLSHESRRNDEVSTLIFLRALSLAIDSEQNSSLAY